jgi:hypothetical protein
METSILDLIDDIESTSIDMEAREIELNKIPEITVDFSLPTETRLRAVEMYFKRFGLGVVEILKRVLSLYLVSNSSLIESYIADICLKTSISLVLRVELAKDMCSISERPVSFMVLNMLLSMAIESRNHAERLDDSENHNFKYIQTSALPDPLFYSAICMLMKSEEEGLREVTQEYLNRMLENKHMDVKYRYKLITSLRVHVSEKTVEYFETQSLKFFICDRDNSIMFRILAGQLYFQKHKDERLFRVFFDIATDESVEYNSRADATDLLLTYGPQEVKESAREIIKLLGKNAPDNNNNYTASCDYSNPGFTIFKDGQNAHNKTIEESALNVLVMLSQERPAHQPLNPTMNVDFDFTEKNILSALHCFTSDNESVKENVQLALGRISLDNKLYSNLNFTLKNALVFVYSYILNQDTDTQLSLMERLIQELSDSAGICSTGIMERVVNTLSGFEDRFSLRISYEDQITGSLSGRLNSKIRNLTALDCLHKTNAKFCDCMMSTCYASRCLLGENSNDKIKIEKCMKCISCLGVACAHDCSTIDIDNHTTNVVGNKICKFNAEFMDLILEEMMLPTSEYDRRSNFLLFFRTYLSDIMEDIRKDYKDILDVASFDLYFRKAIMTYEGEI